MTPRQWTWTLLAMGAALALIVPLFAIGIVAAVAIPAIVAVAGPVESRARAGGLLTVLVAVAAVVWVARLGVTAPF